MELTKSENSHILISSGTPNTTLKSLLLRIAMAFLLVISGKSSSTYLASLSFKGLVWLNSLLVTQQAQANKFHGVAHGNPPKSGVTASAQTDDLAALPLMC
jgi:hypothetical protein